MNLFSPQHRKLSVHHSNYSPKQAFLIPSHGKDWALRFILLVHVSPMSSWASFKIIHWQTKGKEAFKDSLQGTLEP